MRHMVLSDIANLVMDGKRHEVYISSIAFAGVDEVESALRFISISTDPVRWLTFETKRYTYPGVTPMYDTIEKETDAIKESVEVFDSPMRMARILRDFMDREFHETYGCHREVRFFVDYDEVEYLG